MIRGMDRWLVPYLTRDRRRPEGTRESPLHVMIAVCDHFEPFHDTDKAGAMRAMDQWLALWPGIVRTCTGGDGRGPRHSFFFPIEQYDADVIEVLVHVCVETGSEVEVHLHHRDDTAATLEGKLLEGTAALAAHGLLSRGSEGRPVYGFIHGDWALDHSHPAGMHCGVANELEVLRRTGCYADFTLPSAPSPCQVPMVNAIYYAREDGEACSHACGVRAERGTTCGLRHSMEELLLVQGPLGLNWRRRKWGVLPRLENADLTGANPPSAERCRLWRSLAPGVGGGPRWQFVKLHTHGGIPRNYESALLGDAGKRFRDALAQAEDADPTVRFHHVTAREMVNLIHAAEDGAEGNPLRWLNHVHRPPPVLEKREGARE